MTPHLTHSPDGRVRITFDVSQEAADNLVRIGLALNVDTANVVARAFALLTIAVEAKQAGKDVWIVDADRKHATEVLGLDGVR